MSDYTHCLSRTKFSSAATLRALQKITLTLLCTGASLVSAQQLVDISSCARITQDKERFACYDTLARSAGAMPRAAAEAPAAPVTATAPATPATAVAPASVAPNAASAPSAAAVAPAANASAAKPATVAQPTAPAVSTDSTRIAAFGNASQARIEAAGSGQEMLVDIVTALKFYKQDVWLITLSSGQVWRQMIDGRFLLRAGDKVRIVPNPWGNSYRLYAEGRDGFIQVQKIANK